MLFEEIPLLIDIISAASVGNIVDFNPAVGVIIHFKGVPGKVHIPFANGQRHILRDIVGEQTIQFDSLVSSSDYL